MLAPVGSAEAPPLADGPPDAFWDESVKPDGPLSVLVSLPEQRVFVLSNGVVMGSAALQTDAGLAFDGAVLMVMSSAQEDRPSTLDPSQNRYRWASYPVVGQPPPMQDLEAHIKAPPDFMRRLYGVLKPGTTLLVTSIRPLHRRALALSLIHI